MAIKPLFDKVVIKAIETNEKTASGIVLPGAAKEKPQLATVVAVGPGGAVDGKDVAMTAITLYDENGGGYNYFKLRDLGAVLGFTVGYSNETGISITTTAPAAE